MTDLTSSRLISIGRKQWRYYDIGRKTVPPLICTDLYAFRDAPSDQPPTFPESSGNSNNPPLLTNTIKLQKLIVVQWITGERTICESIGCERGEKINKGSGKIEGKMEILFPVVMINEAFFKVCLQ
ncbi:hypothetical protein YC2023_018168 [Brassica napus]